MKIKQVVKIKILLSFIIFSQVISSQNDIINVSNNESIPNGWENLIGKSTEDEVRDKYGSQLTILENVGEYGDGKYCPFEIKNYKLGDYEDFTVSFLFDEKSKILSTVNVTKENPKKVLWIFQNLKPLLIEKYGSPRIVEETPNYNIEWNFEGLDIKLKRTFVAGFDTVLLNLITISYKRSEQSQQFKGTTKPLEKKVNFKQLEVPTFQLFPTENYWTYIKLDTRNGKMWQVHFTISDEGFQGEKDLNTRPLILTDQEINGRFTLLPTKNIYNFILLDQLIGKTYQVQWNDEFLNRFVNPIGN